MAFAACPLDFSRRALSLRGFPGPGAACGFPPTRPSFLPIAFEGSVRSERFIRSRVTHRQRSWGLLPGSPKLPLVWFSKDRPSAVSPACVQSRAAARRLLRFDPPPPSVGFRPPLPFLTTLTVCSACRPTGLFRPVSGHGVQVVSLPASPSLCCHINRSSGRSSHLRSYPPKCSPRQWPPCVTALPFPLAVARMRRFQPSRARPQGVAPFTSPLFDRGVAAALDPILPWALVLFKVLPSSRVLR